MLLFSAVGDWLELCVFFRSCAGTQSRAVCGPADVGAARLPGRRAGAVPAVWPTRPEQEVAGGRHQVQLQLPATGPQVSCNRLAFPTPKWILPCILSPGESPWTFSSNGVNETHCKMVNLILSVIFKQRHFTFHLCSFSCIRVTKNLPYRSHSMSPIDCFQTFISAIFYVGKGKRSRPYSHLYEALDYHRGDKTSKVGVTFLYLHLNFRIPFVVFLSFWVYVVSSCRLVVL